MSDYTQTLVSALEHEALMNVDKMVRLAMAIPNTAGFLATAIQALDQVRRDQGLPIPEAVQLPPPPPEKHLVTEASALATSLIKRSMDGSKS